MKNRTIFVIVDAMRHDYINEIDTPYLFRLCIEGVHAQKIRSTAGFAQRTAIFCGVDADISDNFTMYTFNPEQSPFKGQKSRMLWIRQKISDFFYRHYERRANGATLTNKALKMISFAAARLATRSIRAKLQSIAEHQVAHAPTGAIPLHILPYIGVSEDRRKIWEPGGFSCESIFDVLHRNKINYEYLCYPVVDGNDDETLNSILAARERSANALFIQFSASDSEMHHHGTENEHRRQVMGEIDRKLRRISHHFTEDGEVLNWIIVGDHGMTDVSIYIDAESKIIAAARQLNLKIGRDFLYFLDSTMCRLYFMTQEGRKIESIFEQDANFKEYATKIDKRHIEKYKITENRIYGDALYWLKPGCVFYPDFFHQRGTQVKGMHGYEPDHDTAKGTAIIHTSDGRIPCRKISESDLTDICPTICDLLKVPYPQGNTGKSLISNLA